MPLLLPRESFFKSSIIKLVLDAMGDSEQNFIAAKQSLLI